MSKEWKDDEMMVYTTGSGLSLVKVYNESKKNTNYVNGIDLINQSIAVILETRIGESLSNPKFGSRLYTLSFDSNVSSLKMEMELIIQEDVTLWEPRVDVTNVTISDILYGEFPDYRQIDPKYWSIPVTITYNIRKTGIQGEFNSEVYVAGKSLIR